MESSSSTSPAFQDQDLGLTSFHLNPRATQRNSPASPRAHSKRALNHGHQAADTDGSPLKRSKVSHPPTAGELLTADIIPPDEDTVANNDSNTDEAHEAGEMEHASSSTDDGETSVAMDVEDLSGDDAESSSDDDETEDEEDEDDETEDEEDEDDEEGEDDDDEGGDPSDNENNSEDDEEGEVQPQARPPTYWELQDAFVTDTGDFKKKLGRSAPPLPVGTCKRLLRSIEVPLTKGEVRAYLERFVLLESSCPDFAKALFAFLLPADSEKAYELLLHPSEFETYRIWFEFAISKASKVSASRLERWIEIAARDRNCGLLLLLHARLSVKDPVAAAKHTEKLTSVKSHAQEELEAADVVDEVLEAMAGELDNGDDLHDGFVVSEDDEEDDEEEEEEWFEVQDILASRLTETGELEVLVLWEGYPVSEATWEPAVHMVGEEVMTKWLRRNGYDEQ